MSSRKSSAWSVATFSLEAHVPAQFAHPTEDAHRVLRLASQQAVRRGSHTVGTEHLLLGLTLASKAIPAGALAALGVTFAAVREWVPRPSEGPPDHVRGRPMELSPNARRVMADALVEALLMHRHQVGPEHLALALTRTSVRAAGDILSALKVRWDASGRRSLARLPMGGTHPRHSRSSAPVCTWG